MKRIYLIVLFLLFAGYCYASPSNTMSITPSATNGTTIQASDENTRNSAISSAYNAHTHTDVTQVGNTLSVGDGTGGDKTIKASNADTNKPFIKWDDTNNKWIVSYDGTATAALVTITGGTLSNAYTAFNTPGYNGQVMTFSGGNLTLGGMTGKGQIEYHNGTDRVTLDTIASGAVLTLASGIPAWGGSPNAMGTIAVSDPSANSQGTSTVTGLNFQPNKVMFFSNDSGTSSGINMSASIGFDGFTGTTEYHYSWTHDSVLLGGAGGLDAFRTGLTASTLLYAGTSAPRQEFHAWIDKYNSDGFRVVWQTVGDFPGAVTLGYMAFK